MLSIGCCRGICLRIDSDLFAFEGDSVVVCRNTRCPHWGISIRTPSALGEQMLCYFDHVPRFKSVTLNVFGRGRGFRNACSQLTRRRVRSSTALCSSPPPGPPPTAAYPVARFQYRPVTLADAQIEHTIKSSRMHKAPGPHDIPNEVYGRCADILLPHLGPLFCATFGLNYYPAQWQV